MKPGSNKTFCFALSVFHLCFICGSILTVLLSAAINLSASTDLRFEVTIGPNLSVPPQTGRLFVVLTHNDKQEPRALIGRAGTDAPYVIAVNANDMPSGQTVVLDEHAITFPVTNLSAIPAGNYFVQALLDSNRDLRSPGAPGNLYSDVHKLRLDPALDDAVKLELAHQIPPEQLPHDSEFVKFIKLKSRLLSEFHGRPIYLRAGIVLPRDFVREPNRKYPLWVCIGGLNARYTAVNAFMNNKGEFREIWLSDGTPRFILLQLDGAGPYGDPYQVNSANNGPYGDAITQELIPYVEQHFRGIAQPQARVLSGLSTGGWASLALQVFYPDFFNGTWTFCPDGVDFRAFELVNIYGDESAYTNAFGFERPSERTLGGDVRLTMRREVGIENVMGRGNNWALSGGQWCAWNAVYGPRGANGLPVPLWDPQTGIINRQVAEQWKKYDLRIVMQDNWKTLGPTLRGKLHISVGDADVFFLNNAVHLLDDFLSSADPKYEGRIRYGPGKGHGWQDITLPDMLKEMDAAVHRPLPVK